MKIAFFSNFLNHHQIPFCNEMVKLLGPENFFFIAETTTPTEQLSLGFDDCNTLYPYVVRAYESSQNYDFAKKLYVECDVVIGGSWSDYPLRMRENKLTFNYSERLFRLPFTSLHDFLYLLVLLKSHTRFRAKNLYLLCAGAFVAKDYNRFFSYPGRKFKWGYFTEVIDYDIEKIIEARREHPLRLIWVGRLIPLKQPELALQTIKFLIAEKFDVRLTFVGTGIMEDKMRILAHDQGLDSYVTFLGALPHKDVRSEMLSADIFMFTSTKREGWGAVLNEAMNSGCAVVGSNEIGAVPFLICDGVNGMIYDKNDPSDLFRKVKSLVENQSLRESLGRNAYHTMRNEWSPAIAAQRFLTLCLNILNPSTPETDLFLSGPCSKAE